MNTFSLLTRRAAPICRSCRLNLQRQLSTGPARLVEFQSYSLQKQSPPRDAVIPETTIAQPPRPPPRVHETPKRGTIATAIRDTAPDAPPRIPLSEAEAQKSKSALVDEIRAKTTQTSAAVADPAASTQTSSSPLSSEPTATATPDPAPAPAPKPKPRSRLRSPRKAAMRLTPAAVEHLAALSSAEGKMIKVGVRNRGCSGLQYHLQYVEGKAPLDEVVEQDGVTVLIDGKALFSIIGSEMDWVEDKLQQRFVFRNPNIKEECGCGESFMV